MPRNKLSDPRDPDCAVVGCTNIAGKYRVCEGHARELPRRTYVEFAVKHMAAQHELRREHTQVVLAHFADRLKPWDQRWPHLAHAPSPPNVPDGVLR